MTAGYKSTEFYFSLATAIVGALIASGLAPEGSTWHKLLGVAAMVLASLGYSLSRGLAKSGKSPSLADQAAALAVQPQPSPPASSSPPSSAGSDGKA